MKTIEQRTNDILNRFPEIKGVEITVERRSAQVKFTSYQMRTHANGEMESQVFVEAIGSDLVLAFDGAVSQWYVERLRITQDGREAIYGAIHGAACYAKQGGEFITREFGRFLSQIDAASVMMNDAELEKILASSPHAVALDNGKWYALPVGLIRKQEEKKSE